MDSVGGISIKDTTPVVTAQQILDEAHEIWLRICKRAEDKHLSDAASQELLKEIWDTNRGFYQSYPSVITLMLQGLFHPVALAEHLRTLQDAGGYKSERHFIESQVDYMRRLLTRLNTSGEMTESAIDDMCKAMHKSLIDESERFKSAVEKHAREVEENEAKRAKRRRDELRDWLWEQRSQADAGGGKGNQSGH